MEGVFECPAQHEVVHSTAAEHQLYVHVDDGVHPVREDRVMDARPRHELHHLTTSRPQERVYLYREALDPCSDPTAIFDPTPIGSLE